MSVLNLKTTSAYFLARLEPGANDESALWFASWFYNERGQYKAVWVDFDEAYAYWRDGGR